MRIGPTGYKKESENICKSGSVDSRLLFIDSKVKEYLSHSDSFINNFRTKLLDNIEIFSEELVYERLKTNISFFIEENGNIKNLLGLYDTLIHDDHGKLWVKSRQHFFEQFKTDLSKRYNLKTSYCPHENEDGSITISSGEKLYNNFIYTIENKNFNNLLITDDGSYSGYQIYHDLEAILKSTQNNIHIHICLGFISNSASERILSLLDKYPGAKISIINRNKTIKTVGELFHENNIEEYIKRLGCKKEKDIITNTKSLSEKCLTIFTYKTPDGVSFPQEISHLMKNEIQTPYKKDITNLFSFT